MEMEMEMEMAIAMKVAVEVNVEMGCSNLESLYLQLLQRGMLLRPLKQSIAATKYNETMLKSVSS